MKIDKQMIENAEQQFTGFAQGYYFQDLKGLCISMGLEEYEWNYLKRNKMINCLEKKEVKEINNYFKEKGR